VSGRADDLDAWIDALRGRLDRGELAGLGPLSLRDGASSLPGELVVRIMLADLEHVDDLARLERWAGRAAWRRRALHEELRRLRALIG
jgi:hypothetical protein